MHKRKEQSIHPNGNSTAGLRSQPVVYYPPVVRLLRSPPVPGSELAGQAGQVYGWSPLLVSIIPGLAVMLAGIYALRRI